jgi:hypothetical protein
MQKGRIITSPSPFFGILGENLGEVLAFGPSLPGKQTAAAEYAKL